MSKDKKLSEYEGKRSLIFRIKFFWRFEFWKNRGNQLVLAGAVFLNILNWIILWIWIEPVDLPIILHYNVYFGVDVLGNWSQVFFSPILGIFFLAVDGGMAGFLHSKGEKMGSYLLLLGGLILQFCLVIYSLSLIVINY